MSTCVFMELNWSIADDGLVVTLDRNEEEVCVLPIDYETVIQDAQEDMKSYMKGELSSSELDEWITFRNSLLQMAAGINEAVLGAYHADT